MALVTSPVENQATLIRKVLDEFIQVNGIHGCLSAPIKIIIICSQQLLFDH